MSYQIVRAKHHDAFKITVQFVGAVAGYTIGNKFGLVSGKSFYMNCKYLGTYVGARLAKRLVEDAELDTDIVAAATTPTIIMPAPVTNVTVTVPQQATVSASS